MSTISSTSAGTVTLAGLASGVDTDSIVDSLMEIESAPITTMESKQTYLEAKKDTYEEFNTLLDGFKLRSQGSKMISWSNRSITC